MIHFFRLIRPINLLVIVLTMVGIRLFFLPFLIPSVESDNSEPLHYNLLILCMVLVAAGGNIINDYFDIRADRINKPNKLIVGKYIKKRWAIVFHWTLNLIAFLIACYLSSAYNTYWYVFLILVYINVLWVYSMYFKRKFFIGNFLVAALTGLVPIVCGIHFLGLTTPYNNTNFFNQYLPDESWLSEINLKIFFVLTFSFFAFALNFVREIIKDIEDVKGDLVLRAKTIPIVLGVQKSKWIAITCVFIIFIFSSPFMYEGITLFKSSMFVFMWPIFIIFFILLLVLVLLIRKSEMKSLKLVDKLLKICMFIGCCMPFYWYFI